MTQTAPQSTDPRPLLGRAVDTVLTTVAAVRPDQLTAATPCTEFDVRALLGHVVAVLRRVAAVGRGEDPLSQPHVVTDVADDAWATAASTAAGELRAVWADDALLSRPVRLPFGTLPGAAALTSYAGELSTHTWDLAVATGQQPAWDAAVLRAGLAAIRAKLPTPTRAEGIPFGDAVPVPDDAPLIDQLVAWQGRDPRWTADPR